MVTQNKAAQQRKQAAASAAARAEANGKVEPISFRGLELKLRPKLPLSVIARYGVLRENDIAGSFRILEAMVGREQFSLLMDKLDEEEIDIDDEKGMTEVGELLRSAFIAYGLTEGEAEASDSS